MSWVTRETTVSWKAVGASRERSKVRSKRWVLLRIAGPGHYSFPRPGRKLRESLDYDHMKEERRGLDFWEDGGGRCYAFLT